MLSTILRSRSAGTVLPIPTEAILPNPSQPRKRFDEGDLVSLAESIRQNGIIQPLNVRRDADGRYLLISGERRLRAARLAGLSRVPCIVLQVDEQRAAVLALLENLQREDLSCFEEAEGIQRLIEQWGITREEAALRLGKAQSTLANKLRLLQLHPWQRKRIEAAGLCERHARALLRLEPARREEALNLIIAKQLTVGETDELVSKMLEPPPPPAKKQPVFRDLRLFVNTINHAVDTMRRSGVQATADKQESERFIEYHIVIPKPVELPPPETVDAGVGGEAAQSMAFSEEEHGQEESGGAGSAEPSSQPAPEKIHPIPPLFVIEGRCSGDWDTAQKQKTTPDEPPEDDAVEATDPGELSALETLLQEIIGARKNSPAYRVKKSVRTSTARTQACFRPDEGQTTLEGFPEYTGARKKREG